MLLLALDTTTRAGSVAVVRDDDVLAVVEGDAARTHGERLPGEIARALVNAGIDAADLELLVVASGPGAFTGLRIGLASVQGLAMVLDIPVVGVSALDALASATRPALVDAGERALLVWMDALRGEVFSAQYVVSGSDVSAWYQPGDPVVSSPARILESLADTFPRDAVFVGDGAIRYQPEIEAWSHGQARVLDPPRALAPALAHVGRYLADAGLAGPPHMLQPLYVRRPDAELERLRRPEK